MLPKLVDELQKLIEETRKGVAHQVNSAMTLMYWYIGNKLQTEVMIQEEQSIKPILQEISKNLQKIYGKGYSYSALTRMIKFSNVIDKESVATLSQQLSWSHIITILPIDDSLQRAFYIQMSISERWGVRTLRERIDSMLYERTMLSKKPKELIDYEIQMLKEGSSSLDLILKDPYILDFLALNDRYLERDLEDAILREIEHFILELGSGFSFIARQKRIIIDGDDFKIDLLFYNRKLKRLIAIDLKIGRFKASYKGQMELYLKWLEKYEIEEGENPPLGIILCANKQSEQIALLELDKSNIHVAEYLTVLPPKEVLEKKLHDAIDDANNRYKIETR